MFTLCEEGSVRMQETLRKCQFESKVIFLTEVVDGIMRGVPECKRRSVDAKT